MSKRVTVEVEEGSRSWAMAMHDAGKKVECVVYNRDIAQSEWIVQNPHYNDAVKWRLYVEPPQPITVQPGTFPWAIAKALEGKKVRRPSDPPRFFFTKNSDLDILDRVDLKATDWEVVE